MIERDDIKKLADLGRIEVKEDELDLLRRDIESILAYVSEIKDVTGKLRSSDGERENVMRDDGEPHAPGLYTEKLLSFAPHREGNYILVKKILTQN